VGTGPRVEFLLVYFEEEGLIKALYYANRKGKIFRHQRKERVLEGWCRGGVRGGGHLLLEDCSQRKVSPNWRGDRKGGLVWPRDKSDLEKESQGRTSGA